MKNIISIIRLLFAIIFILSIGIIGVTSYQINLLSNTKNYVNIGTDGNPQYVLQDIAEYSNTRWVAVYMLITSIVVLIGTVFFWSNVKNSDEYKKIKKQIDFEIGTEKYLKMKKILDDQTSNIISKNDALLKTQIANLPILDNKFLPSSSDRSSSDRSYERREPSYRSSSDRSSSDRSYERREPSSYNLSRVEYIKSLLKN